MSSVIDGVAGLARPPAPSTALPQECAADTEACGKVEFQVKGNTFKYSAPAGGRAFVRRSDETYRMIYPGPNGPSTLAFLNLPKTEPGVYTIGANPGTWAVFATGRESYISRTTCGPLKVHVDGANDEALWGNLEGTFCQGGSPDRVTIKADFSALRPGSSSSNPK